MSRISDRVISYSFVGRFNNLTAGLTAAGRSVDNFNTRLTATDRNGERMRRGLTTIGDAAGKMGLAAAAGLGVIIAATVRFDKAMSAVQAATGESAAGMEKLRAAAIKAGADTIFSATEAAEGITELGKAGLSTADILSGGLTGALNLAAAGQISVSDAASTTATTLSQFGLAGDQASRVADTLAAASGKALGSVEDMAGALKYVGPVAAQMGLSLEDASGAIAELASQGILGESAGTALRGMLTSLTSPSKAAAKEMSNLGINLYDAQGKFVGLDGIAGQLQSTMSGLTEAERNQSLGRIFGNEQITAARILYAGGSQAVQDWTDKVTDSGYAASTASKLTDNLAGDLEAFKGSLETALIGAGEGSQGPLRGLVQGATEAVNVFNTLPGPIKSATTGLLAIVAVTGGAAFFGAKVVSGIAATNVALAQLGVTARLTGASLATASASVAGLAVVTAGYGTDAISMQDSWNRSRGASDAYGDSIDRVTANLQKSNVGKYASDLGIDINKLADDLVRNGESGTYASTVMQQLEDSGHGASAVFKDYASNVLPFYTSGASKAFDASLDLNNIVDGMSEKAATAQDVIGLLGITTDQYNVSAHQAAASTASVIGPTIQMAAAAEDNAKALEDARKAAGDTAGQFFNLGASLNDSKVSLDDWITDLEKQAKALRDFKVNAQEAGDKGLRKGLLAALEEAGPEGAMRLAQLADASKAEINRANKAWKSGENQIASYIDTVTAVPPANLRADGTQAKSVLTDVKGKVTDLGKMVARVLVEANTNPAKSAIAGVRAELASLKDKTIYVNVRRPNAGGTGPQLRAGGGAVYGPGTSTSDSIPAALSNGEYVVKTKAVNRYGVAMMDAINQERFATGGLAGFATGGKVRTARRQPIVVDADDPRYNAPDGKKAQLRYFKDFEHDAKKALGGLQHSLAAATVTVDANKDAVDRETSARDGLQSSFDNLSSSITGMLTSDLFGGGSGNPFSASASSDPISILMSDIAGNQQFQDLFAGLRAEGLHGGALTAAAQGGIAGLQTLSAYNPEQIAQFQQLFDIREQQGAATGQQVAQAQFGQALAEANAKADIANGIAAQSLVQQAAIEAAIRNQEQTVKQSSALVEKATKDISSTAAKGGRSKTRKNR